MIAVVSNPEQFLKDFEINISDTGRITVDGIEDTMSYNMKEYTKESALKDFCTTRLHKFTNLIVHSIVAI